MTDHPVITINGPGHDGTRVVLPEGITSFGRLPSNDIVLIDDLVSRNHARITYFEGRATLQDLGSHNGCYVNGHRIEGARPLNAGDLCRIGPFQLLVRRGASDVGRALAARLGVPGPPPPDPAVYPSSSSLLAQIEATRRRTDDHPRALQVLLRATEALASATELEEYLDSMLRLALDQTGAVRGAYVEPTPAGLQIKQVAGEDGAGTDAKVAPAVVDWAVSKNYPLRVDDLADDLRFEGPSQALLCVPVAYGDEVLGAFHVARDLPPFPLEALDALVAVAHLTGTGIRASQARRTAVRAKLARDTLARTFHPRIAEALADGAGPEVHPRQMTILLVAPRAWPAGVGSHESRGRLGPVLGDFSRRVLQQEGHWHIGPGPTLFGVFEDDAGPARAVTVVDGLRAALAPPLTFRAAVARGTVLTGVTDAETWRLPVLAGPGLEDAERLVGQVPTGQVWLTDSAARLYPGPLRQVGDGAFVPG